VPAFVARSRTYAGTLPDSARTLLVVETGAKLVQPSAPDASIEAGDGCCRRRTRRRRGGGRRAAAGRCQVVERASLGAYTTATRTYANGAIFTGWYVGATPEARTQNEAEATQRRYSRREVMVPSGPPLWVERDGAGGGGGRGGAPGVDAVPAAGRGGERAGGRVHARGRAGRSWRR
jgi:hypothetical protein